MNLGDLLRTQAAQYPDSPALYCGDATASYGELDASSEALAGWFESRGLKPGDRVAIQWPNAMETARLYFAAFKAGLIVVPVNLRLKPPEIAWVIENSGAKICFTHPMLADAMRQTGVEVLTELPESGAGPFSVSAVDEDAPAIILYTSGSTGRPKGAVHTHRSLLDTARICTQDFVGMYGAGSQSRGLIMTPLMHASGLYVLLGVIWLGQASVLLPVFGAAEVLDAIERYRCGLTLALPAMMQFVLEEQVKWPRDVSSLK